MNGREAIICLKEVTKNINYLNKMRKERGYSERKGVLEGGIKGRATDLERDVKKITCWKSLDNTYRQFVAKTCATWKDSSLKEE